MNAHRLGETATGPFWTRAPLRPWHPPNSLPQLHAVHVKVMVVASSQIHPPGFAATDFLNVPMLLHKILAEPVQIQWLA
jgi:hypothetical protein